MNTVLRRLFLVALLIVVLLALLLVVETTGAQGTSASVSAGQEYTLSGQTETGGVDSKLVLAIALMAVGLLVPVGAIVYLRFFRKRPPKG